MTSEKNLCISCQKRKTVGSHILCVPCAKDSEATDAQQAADFSNIQYGFDPKFVRVRIQVTR